MKASLHAKSTRRQPRSQLCRLATAVLAIACALAAVAVSQPVAQMLGWIELMSSQPDTGSSSGVGRAGEQVDFAESFGLDGAADGLPAALFAQVAGTSAPTANPPAAFAEEVVASDELDAVEQVCSASTVGIVSPLEAGELCKRIEEALEERGWTSMAAGNEVGTFASGQASDETDLSASGADEGFPGVSTANAEQLWQASFRKPGGTIRWLHVALYPVGSVTTCVFQMQGMG